MRFKQLLPVVALLALLALMLPGLAAAQSVVTGGISGTVTDPTGAVIVGAKITLSNPATGETQVVTSSASGVYNLALLRPGHYNMTVSRDGFKTAELGVDVVLGQVTPTNVKLETGSVSTTVEVTAQGQLLQTENANLTSNFDTQQIQNIPNPGGDITYLANTSPGVTMNNSTAGGYGNFSAFGLPGTANLFTVNGNDYNCPFLNLNNSGSSNLLLGGNELQEETVVSNGYTGQYGRQAGAQIDYTTKSGTNAFHGDAVYYWTGRALNANDPVNKFLGGTRPFENNNQWAASIGGPIKKDKAWFFVNTEGIRYIFGSITNVVIPSADFQKFVLGNIPQDAPTVAFYNNIFSLYNNANAKAGNRAAPVTGSCPSDLPSFGAGALTDCYSTYGVSSSNGNKEWLMSGRVDYSFSDTDKLFGRFKIDRGTQPTYTDPLNSAFDNNSIQPQDDGQLNYTHVFSPNVVNNFIGSVLWYSAIFKSPDQSTALGLFPGNMIFQDAGLDPFGYQLTALGTGSGSPGGAQAGFLFPQGRDVTQWGLIDDLSITRGSHAFKMGFNFRKDDISDHTASEVTQYPLVNLDLFGFANDQVFDSAAGIGNVTQRFSETLEQPLAYYSVGFYFQDEWRVNSKLKLTLTGRFDHNSPGVCQHNCTALTSAPFIDMPKGPTIPYNSTYLDGFHQIIPDVEKVVFEPRFGFAWTPIGDKTVFRGGVGLFSDLYPGFVLDSYTTNFPEVVPWVLSTGKVAFSTNPSDANFPTSGVNILANPTTGCNSLFLTNYHGGGTYNSYAASAPNCTNAFGQTIVPNYNALPNKILNPKYLEWNFEIQRTLAQNLVLSANYVGNHGYDELINNPYLNAYCNAACVGTTAGNIYNLSNVGLPTSPADPRVGSVGFLNNIGYSNYNGITISLQETGWHGLSGRFNYTYSHSLDTSSDGGLLPFSVITSILPQINPFSISDNYADSDYDVRHNISGSYVYQLPFKSENRLMNAAIGGWMVSGTMFWHSAFPFSVVDFPPAAALAATNNMVNSNILLQPVAGFTQRNFPDGRTCLAWLKGGPTCFNQADFQNPTNFTGNVAGRNAFRGPGFLGGDLSVRKNFQFTERLNFQVGASAYNFLNHANYGNPLGSTQFGIPLGGTFFTSTPPTSPYGAFASAATDMRMVQVFGKFVF